jgi:hypothetical protein
MNSNQKLIPSTKLKPNKSNIYTKLIQRLLNILNFIIEKAKTKKGRVRKGHNKSDPEKEN